MGVLALLGDRVWGGAKLLLLSIAMADDIIAAADHAVAARLIGAAGGYAPASSRAPVQRAMSYSAFATASAEAATSARPQASKVTPSWMPLARPL